MAAPMREGPLDSGHRAKVADPRTAAAKAEPAAAAAAAASNNFEYDDNEWDIGIGDLIIDLDADIEKTNEKSGGAGGGAAAAGGAAAMASAGGGGGASKGAGKMAVEHSATVDKGLKMKIKRTKPGTKTSEAKHEIVKPGEQNGGDAGPGEAAAGKGKHPTAPGGAAAGAAAGPGGAAGGGGGGSGGGGGGGGSGKRGSSGHRRDKARDKHGGDKGAPKPAAAPAPPAAGAAVPAPAPAAALPDVNGVVRSPGPAGAAAAAAAAAPASGPAQAPSAGSPVAPAAPVVAQLPSAAAATAAVPATQQAQQPPQQPQRVVFPVSSGPGPPAAAAGGAASVPGPPAVPASPAPAGAAPPMKAETPGKAAEVPDDGDGGGGGVGGGGGGGPTSPPPAKKLKTEPKDMLDVCVGTSVGTITEPDCLGPCEPGTSVTLEGIVWHETEGGVLVVNVTWRGKTYVGTLLDCTRHDWAPPRFCDSPTSDLDARIPKGRGKRGRAAASASPGGDLSNFTETRSSVHSKLRNGGAKGRRGGGGGGGSSAGSTSSGSNSGSNSGNSAGTGSPTPFIPPRPESTKRKGRASEEAESPGPGAKKTRTPASASGSPPASPVLLECPEPNCSKKYKHINGLKYHQSHAHGCADDEDTKDAASLSENDESNVEAPSPAPSAKSPEKLEPAPAVAPATPAVCAPAAVPSPAPAPQPIAVQAPPQPASQAAPQPVTPAGQVAAPVVTPVSAAAGPPPAKKEEVLAPASAAATLGPVAGPEAHSLSQPSTPKSRTVSPTPAPPLQLQPQPPELVPAGATPLTPLPGADAKSVLKPGVLRFGPPPADEYPVGVFCGPGGKAAGTGASSAPVSAIRAVRAGSPGQAPATPGQAQTQQLPSQQPAAAQPPAGPQPLAQLPPAKPQFKVKPTASLMPDDKKDRNKVQGHKKKNRKSPAGSPHPQPEQPTFGMDASGREDVQSPAYSDISDDTAPVLESEVGDAKGKGPSGEKKAEVGQGPSPHSMPHYGMYPFYGQPPYLVPSVQQDGKAKDAAGDKLGDGKVGDKDKKETGPGGDYPQKLLQQHYYPYGYVPGYPYNLEPSYPMSVMPAEDKAKDMVGKEDKSPSPAETMKGVPLAPSPIQVPNPNKVKTEPGLGLKDKHQSDNHQILKESIEMKSQLNPYTYQRPAPVQQAAQSAAAQASPQHTPAQTAQQQQEELRRYYLYPDQQRRKDAVSAEAVAKAQSGGGKSLASPSHKHKDKQAAEEKKEEKVKQEGVKPTMETQGPPPPPTSSYAYIHHPSYMQAPHYGALPFDPGHPMYRSMLVPGPYGANPYLHPQLPRYPHAPEDLSRPPSGPPKALDLLQHHASQYYSSHKIHELQERALKSPTPKPVASSASPSGAPPSGQPGAPASGSAAAPQGPSQAASAVVPGSQSAAAGKPTPGGGGGSGCGSNGAGGGGAAAGAEGGKEARSPPPQRHVHTHHHTHVGLGYPILAGQYPAPYGAAVLASQQAAAVAATVINPYPPK